VFSRPFGTLEIPLGCPSTSCWAMFGRPFGTLVLIPDGGAWRGGCSAVPSGLDWFMWVSSQHFVLGYVRSSLRDLIYATISNVFFSKVGSLSRAAFDS